MRLHWAITNTYNNLTSFSRCVVYAFAWSRHALPLFEQTQLERLQPTELHKGKRTILATFGFLLGEKELGQNVFSINGKRVQIRVRFGIHFRSWSQIN